MTITKRIRRDARTLGLVVLSAILALNAFPTPDERVAIVCFVEGKVRVTDAGAKASRDLQLFDWIKAGAVLDTAEGARVVVASAQGERYELSGKGRATLTANGITSASGRLVTLSSVPVMPRILALAAESNPGRQLPAIRLRGSKAQPADLYPSDGAAVTAEGAALSFGPVEGVEKYRVELDDAWGNKLLSVETASLGVAVSPGILKPGAGYSWSVRTLGNARPSSVADADFVTLSEEQAKLRDAFRILARQSKDAAQLLLLARLESALNIRKDACATLREALALSPQNAEIGKALDRMACK